ncbi:MAG TPA: hypothetical protein VLV83_21310 [Acidobacteriota bacterium]|nr:hypothetical protein [Acidobacteriota bacterium]
MRFFGILSIMTAFLTFSAQAGQTVKHFPHYAFGRELAEIRAMVEPR